MDKIAEKLSGWFGSTPFIMFHFVWFTAWILLHMLAGFDPDWAILTVVVSLEAIFLSLFILRAENIQSARTEREVKKDLKKSDEVIQLIKKGKK